MEYLLVNKYLYMYYIYVDELMIGRSNIVKFTVTRIYDITKLLHEFIDITLSYSYST